MYMGIDKQNKVSFTLCTAMKTTCSAQEAQESACLIPTIWMQIIL